MRKAILILTLSVLAFAPDLSGQSKKRGTHAPAKQTESPCGIPIPTASEFVEELKVEWREVGGNAHLTWYYNTRKQVCEKGILKVWTKAVNKDDLSYSVDHVDVNCRLDKTRLTASVDYAKDGSVIKSINLTSPEWQDVFPDSGIEAILEAVCRKPH